MDHTPHDYKFDEKPHVMLVRTTSCGDVADRLIQGAVRLLDQVGVTHGIHEVPGPMEIPAAILYAVKALNFDASRRRYDGYVALGCVIGKGREENFVAEEAVRGLQTLVLEHTLAVGNGLLICDTREQALALADFERGDQGGIAADACLRMIELKHHFRLSAKRRWIAR